jgi:restriction system protein
VDGQGASTATPLERLEDAYKSLSSTLSADIIDRVLTSSPVFFEKMVVKLLTEMGYGATIEEAAQHIGGPNDGGVDGVIHLDRLGIDKVYIQAKRYAQTTTVSRQDVQAFSGALDDKQTTRGVFITTSSFSSGALAYVKNITKQIVLIDGHRLAQLMIRHGVGVRVERVMEIKRVDEDFFEDT